MIGSVLYIASNFDLEYVDDTLGILISNIINLLAGTSHNPWRFFGTYSMKIAILFMVDPFLYFVSGWAEQSLEREFGLEVDYDNEEDYEVDVDEYGDKDDINDDDDQRSARRSLLHHV